MNIADAVDSAEGSGRALMRRRAHTHTLSLSLWWSTVAAGEYSWYESRLSRLSLVAMHQCELSTALVSGAVDNWLYPVCHAARRQLPGHTHPLNKKQRNARASLSLDWAEWNNILGILQITPIRSDIAAVTREMRKYQNNNKWCQKGCWLMSFCIVIYIYIYIANHACVIKVIIHVPIPVIFVGYSLFSENTLKGARSCWRCNIILKKKVT